MLFDKLLNLRKSGRGMCLNGDGGVKTQVMRHCCREGAQRGNKTQVQEGIIIMTMS